MTYDIYSAFGNQVRNKLLLCLSQKPKNVSELIDTCGLSQSAVSQHLAKLKKSGLVQTEKVGKQIYYTLTYPQAANISQLIISLDKKTI